MAPPTQALAAATPPPVIDPADRLSQLPPEIQAQILSFLPAQEAVRTCVLARRWRDRWKLMRSLLITRGKHVLLQEVCGFVDRLLRLRLDGLMDHGPIDVCEILFNLDDDYNDDDYEVSCAVGRWITRVLECQVKSLLIHILPQDRYDDVQMQDILPLVSQHLTRLELCGLWFFEANSCLDFSGCPVLEHLEITSCDMSFVSKVTSPSVKCLVITDCAALAYDCLQICFPLLVSLRLETVHDRNLVLEGMPKLAVAHVSIDKHPSPKDEEDITKCMILKGLAEAKHLVLLPGDETITFTRDLRFCPTYSNLKTLVLNQYWCESADCGALACMLQHAPVLEKLTVLFSLKVEPKYDIVIEGHSDATGNSTMTSQHLKIVELKCFEVNQRVVNVLRFLGTLNISFKVLE